MKARIYTWTKQMLALAAAVATIAGPAQAAQSHDHDHEGESGIRRCYAMENLERQMAEDPTLAARMDQMERETQYMLKERGNAQTNAIRTIPVYVHVIYNTAVPAENISDAQINSQISVLNADYSATNSDVSGIPTEFQGVKSGDTEIRFVLAGITRKASTKTSWGTADAMKKSSQGGVDPITPSTHMNMWVCNIGGGILGYAQFPGGAAATDGVVASPQYFGSSAYGSGFYLSAPFDKGRTMTHEVGHYLNLRHIWGDGSSCGATDYVDDTPFARAANYGCPGTVNSCTGTSYPGNDMTMNYMDYTDDNCMFMFSAGQKARMWACLTSSRSTLGTGGSGGNVSPTANANGPYSATTGTAISFSSAGSSDPDGSIASYSWNFGDGTTSTSANPSKSYTTAGTYTVTLTVTDNAGATGTATATATITTSGGGGSYITAESESNNTAATADGPMGNNINVSGAMGSNTDVDWYFFNMNTTGSITITLTIGNTSDMDWYLYKSTNTTSAVASGAGTSNPEVGSYSVTTTGKYVLKVSRYSGTRGSYTVKVAGTGMAREGGDEVIIEAKQFEVSKAYPNPFSKMTTISYALSNASNVKVQVFNAAGQLVKTLADEAQTAGQHAIQWDGTNQYGESVSAGTYFYQVQAGSNQAINRMQFVK